MAELPNYLVSETDKYKDDGQWFKNWAKYIASLYNSQFPKTDGNQYNGFSTGNGAYNTDTQGAFSNTPIGQINRWYEYYSGQQPNRDYGWSERDGSGAAYGPTWIRGQKISQLVDYQEGNALKLLQNMKISTRALSEAATNKRTQAIEKFRFFSVIKPILEEIGIADTGVEYAPLGGIEEEFDFPEQVYEYLEKNYKEEMEEYSKIIADDFIARTDAKNVFRKSFKDAVIAGITALEFYARGNRVETRQYEGDAIIWDNSKDDPLNQDCRFVGLIRWMTPSEVLDTWGEEKLGKELYEKILNISKESASPTNLFIEGISNSGLPSSQTTAAGKQIPILTSYWRASKDTRYVVSEEDKYGNKHVVRRKKDDENAGDYWMETWYQCVTVANLGYVDMGECYNNVERISDKRRIEPPVKVFMPHISRGGLSSLVSRLYQHQDRKDFLMNEITKMIDKAYGRVLAVNGQKLGDTKFSAVVEDFKRYGVSVINTTANGDEDDENNNRPLMEAYDMTLDPNFNAYMVLMDKEDAIMEEIAGTSKVALGQQQGYISVNSQQVTIGQNSLQTFPLYMGFMRYIACVLQHAVNMQKNMLAGAIDEENKKIPLISEQGIRYLKEVDDFAAEDFGVYIKIDDVISEESKARLNQMAFAWSQNPAFGVTPPDLVKMEKATTFSEAVQVLENAFARQKRDQKRQEQQAMMMQQIQQQQMMQQAQEAEAMKQGAETERTAMKLDANAQQTQLKSETELAKAILSKAPMEAQEE